MTSMAIIVLAFIVIGLPVILGICSEIYKRRLAFEERKLELLAGQSSAKAEMESARTKELEQRVRVLEQIVTDSGAQTAAQIEALRERPKSIAGTSTARSNA